MADGLVKMSEGDVRVLKDMVAAFRLKRGQGIGSKSTRNPMDDDDNMTTAPEVYIARAPTGGIPALDAATAGTGPVADGDDVPGTADCELYDVQHDGTVQKIGLTKQLHNISDKEILEGAWVLAVRDKGGRWWAILLSAAPKICGDWTFLDYSLFNSVSNGTSSEGYIQFFDRFINHGYVSYLDGNATFDYQTGSKSNVYFNIYTSGTYYGRQRTTACIKADSGVNLLEFGMHLLHRAGTPIFTGTSLRFVFTSSCRLIPVDDDGTRISYVDGNGTTFDAFTGWIPVVSGGIDASVVFGTSGLGMYYGDVWIPDTPASNPGSAGWEKTTGGHKRLIFAGSEDVKVAFEIKVQWAYGDAPSGTGVMDALIMYIEPYGWGQGGTYITIQPVDAECDLCIPDDLDTGTGQMTGTGSPSGGFDVETYTTPGADQTTVPFGATGAVVECRSGGGGGGSGNLGLMGEGAGGGGGGGYAKKTYTGLIAGTVINYVVGAGGIGGVGQRGDDGGSTSWDGGAALFVDGGLGSTGGSGALGGGTSAIGDVTFVGGNGGSSGGTNPGGCGGGGAAGDAGTGSNGVDSTGNSGTDGGAGGTTGGGAGGHGKNKVGTAGTVGVTPGGGGGGGGGDGNDGMAGANGQIIVTWS